MMWPVKYMMKSFWWDVEYHHLLQYRLFLLQKWPQLVIRTGTYHILPGPFTLCINAGAEYLNVGGPQVYHYSPCPRSYSRLMSMNEFWKVWVKLIKHNSHWPRVWNLSCIYYRYTQRNMINQGYSENFTTRSPCIQYQMYGNVLWWVEAICCIQSDQPIVTWFRLTNIM